MTNLRNKIHGKTKINKEQQSIKMGNKILVYQYDSLFSPETNKSKNCNVQLMHLAIVSFFATGG